MDVFAVSSARLKSYLERTDEDTMRPTPGTATKYRILPKTRILERTRMFGQDGNEQTAENISQASNSTACICYESIGVMDLSLRNPFISDLEAEAFQT